MQLKAKVTLLVSLMIVFSIGSAYFLISGAFERAIKEQLAVRYSVTATQVSENLKNTFKTLNWLFIEKTLALLLQDESVVFCHIISPDKSIYISSDRNLYGEPANQEWLTLLANQKSLSISSSDGVVILEQIRINGEPWVIALGLSYGIIKNQILLMRQQTFMLSMLLIMIAVTTGYFFTRRITEPLNQLTKVCESVAEENFESLSLLPSGLTIFESNDEVSPDSTLARRKKDEIYVLVNAFSKMLKGINERDNQIRNYYAELEKKVEERTYELNEARQTAESANKSKSNFLATMSHEIRTPINGIMGMAHILLDSSLNPIQKKYAEIISSNTESLLEIINDILDFSKIEAEKLEIESIPFNLRETLDSILDVLSFKADEKKIDLILKVDARIESKLTGDPGRIRQILLNLAANAIKFTANGQVILKASLKEKTGETARILFEVQDTGIGIPEEKLNLLFTPFGQLDPSISRNYAGTGLGLAISKRLVELMNGVIGVESVEGKGSTFWVELSIPGHASDNTQEKGVFNLKDLSSVTVVGNNPESLAAISEMLKFLQLEHQTFLSPEELLKKLSRVHETSDLPDMVLVDYDMHEARGTEFARALAESQILAGIPVVLITSIRYLPEARKNCPKNVTCHLTKPVRFYDLLGILSKSPNPPEEDSTEYVEVTEKTNNASGNILLAEDNETNQLVAISIINRLGYRIDPVFNGAEALQALENKTYDLVLMDIQMPVMDGFATTKAIRNSAAGEKNSKIPIIAMTAHAFSGYREQCLAAGMNDYISKPFDHSNLARLLRRYMPDTNPDSTTETAKICSSNVYASLLPKLGNDADLTRKVLNVFLKDLESILPGMRQHFDAKEFAELAREAHRLKGAAGNIMATELSSIASSLELSIEKCDFQQAEQNLEDFISASSRFVAEASRHI